MEFVYMFTGGDPDYKWVSKTAFFREFGLNQAIGYLETIRNRLHHERGRRTTDFYTGCRHVFAELDGLGKLFSGEEGPHNTAKNAVNYGEEYLGRIDPGYRELYGLLFDVYRHGLMHTGLIRTVRLQAGERLWHLKWGLEARKARHLSLDVMDDRSCRLWISLPQLRDDAAGSVDLYIQDLKSRGRRSKLFYDLRRGYYGTALALRDGPTKAKTPRTKKYSARGLTWIRARIRERA